MEKETGFLRVMITAPFRNGHVSPDVVQALRTLAVSGLTIYLI